MNNEYEPEVRRKIEDEYVRLRFDKTYGVDLSNALFIEIKKIYKEKSLNFLSDASIIYTLRDAIVKVILAYWRSGEITSEMSGALVHYVYNVAKKERLKISYLTFFKKYAIIFIESKENNDRK